MAFIVAKSDGKPNFDSLPVAKIIHYPFELRDYKPYAQARLALGDNLMFIDLWAFETRPDPESGISARLRMPSTDGSSVTLEISAFANGKVDFSPSSVFDGRFAPEVTPLAGEDLQGEYWGVSVRLPLAALESAEILSPVSGTKFWGNFFKFSRGNRPHLGSFAPFSDKPSDAEEFFCGGTEFSVLEY